VPLSIEDFEQALGRQFWWGGGRRAVGRSDRQFVQLARDEGTTVMPRQ
jgi:hypothetical protein